ERELARDRTDSQGTAQLLVADGLRHVARGDLSRAAEVFDEGAKIAADAGVKNAYTIPAVAWGATARRIAVERAHDYTPLKRESALKSSWRSVRRARWASWLCRNDLAQSLRDYALLLAMRGKLRRSRRAFEKSLKVARKLRQ